MMAGTLEHYAWCALLVAAGLACEWAALDADQVSAGVAFLLLGVYLLIGSALACYYGPAEEDGP